MNLNNCTKEQQAEQIKKIMDISKAKALEFITAYEEVMAKAIRDGRKVKVNNIGVLERVEVPGRNYRNPATGGEIYKTGYSKVKFKISKELKASLNLPF